MWRLSPRHLDNLHRKSPRRIKKDHGKACYGMPKACFIPGWVLAEQLFIPDFPHVWESSTKVAVEHGQRTVDFNLAAQLPQGVRSVE